MPTTTVKEKYAVAGADTINLLRDELLALDVVHIDETTVQVLKEVGRAAQSTSYIWAQCSGQSERPIVLFDYDASRSGDVPERLLEGFRGYLHTDAYSGYNAVVESDRCQCANSCRSRRRTCASH